MAAWRRELGDSPVPLGLVARGVWVAENRNRRVLGSGDATDRREVINVGDRPTAVATEQRAIWVANAGDDNVWRVRVK